MNSQTSQPVVKHRRQDRKISTSLRSASKVPVEDVNEVVWPRVDLSVVFPKSLTCEEVGLMAVMTSSSYSLFLLGKDNVF